MSTPNESNPDATPSGEDESELTKQQKEAQRFWNRYEIPIEFGTAIKVRKSGLSRGSWGDGRARDTVVHFHVKEPFRDGRLSRGADTLLCEKGSHVTKQAEEKSLGDGIEQEITCSTCRERMRRWWPAIQGGNDE